MPEVMNEKHHEIESRIHKILYAFQQTARTEVAFYLQFQRMPGQDMQTLMYFYEVEDEWKVFKRICRFWSVKL